MWHIDAAVIRLLDVTRAYPCRDRQLLATHLGEANRRHVRTGQQRDRAARRQSGRGPIIDTLVPGYAVTIHPWSSGGPREAYTDASKLGGRAEGE
jgi:hypothetical protein